MKSYIYINGLLPALICGGLLYIFSANIVLGAPAAADLLEACEQSLNSGFDGITGDMCAWYVTPCDCDSGKENNLPRVCLPESVPLELLARTVIEGLKDEPDLQLENADFAAATILSRVYPCDQ